VFAVPELRPLLYLDEDCPSDVYTHRQPLMLALAQMGLRSKLGREEVTNFTWPDTQISNTFHPPSPSGGDDRAIHPEPVEGST